MKNICLKISTFFLGTALMGCAGVKDDSNTDNQVQKIQYIDGFGYKAIWYMTPEKELTENNLSIQDLADFLKFTNQQSMDWNEGISYSNELEQAYITPPLNGWVYIKIFDENMDSLDGFINNYYAFASYRVVDFVGWKKVVNGKVVRYFNLSDGTVHANIGLQTKAEKSLKLVNLSGMSNQQAIDFIHSDEVIENDNIPFPSDEEIPIKICERWTGVNPSTFYEKNILIPKQKGIAGNVKYKPLYR